VTRLAKRHAEDRSGQPSDGRAWQRATPGMTERKAISDAKICACAARADAAKGRVDLGKAHDGARVGKAAIAWPRAQDFVARSADHAAVCISFGSFARDDRDPA
jgi:hypothetical protein